MKKHYKKSRRMLSFLLCFLMTFTMLPTMAFAESSVPAEENAAVTADVTTLEDTSSNKDVATENGNSEVKEVVDEETQENVTEASSVEVTEEGQNEELNEELTTEPAAEEQSVSLAMNGQGQGQHDQYSYLNHIDVRVDATLTLVTKVNGKVIKRETVNVTTSRVSGSLNGRSLSFYKKSGQGTENEWRCDNLNLDPRRDTVTINCTLSGRTSSGQSINVQMNNTYDEETTLWRFVRACPAQNGYDIDYEAEQVSEEFTVDKTVTKVWDDNNDAGITRPESVQIQLYKDGVAYGDPVTLSARNNWTASYEGLPKYSSETKEVNYTVDEVSVPAGYTKSINGMTITNRLSTKNIDVQKAWKDEGWQSYRPESVVVNLLANGEKVDSLTLTAANNWKGTFKDVPVVNSKGDIKYTVVEESSLDSNYTTKYTHKGDSWTVTNTWSYESKPASVTIKAKKTMDGNAATGSSFSFQLKDSNDEVVQTVNNKDGNIEFDELTFKEAGTYEYTVSEVAGNEAGVNYDDTVYIVKINVELDGKDYAAKITYLNGDTTCDELTFANTTKTKNIDVQKAWVDKGWESYRPESVVINLLANGEKADSLTLTADANWKGTFENKPVVDEQGNIINYTVTEEVASDSKYTPTYTSDGDSWLVTNTWSYVAKPGTLVVSKTVSGDGADKTQEFTFKVTLVAPITGSDIDNTSGGILIPDSEKLPELKVDDETQKFGDVEFVNGVATFRLKHGESKTVSNIPAGYAYTVEEIDSDGYTVTVNGTEATSLAGTIEDGDVVKAAFNNYKAADTADDTDDEEEVTETKAPATGDNSNTILWIVVAIAAVAALGGVFYSRKRMNKR